MSAKWPRVRLGEVLTFRAPDTVVIPDEEYQFAGVYSFGRGVFRGQKRLGSEFSYPKLTRLKQGDFVYPKLMAWEGAFGIVPKECAGCYVSPEFPVLQADPQRLLPGFLGYQLQAPGVWSLIVGPSKGTNVRRRRLHPDDLLSKDLLLPSLAEQRRIVERIQELATIITEARSLRDRTSEESSILFRRYSGTIFDRTSESATVPLEQVCDCIVDCLHSNPVYASEGVPTVRSPDVGWGDLLLSSALRTSQEEYVRRTRRCEPRPGDIIVVREGGGTGKAGIVEEGQRLSLGQRVMQIRPDPAKILPRFLLHQWLSPVIQDGHVAPLSKGSASPHLNIRFIKRFPLSLPSLSEQRLIVDYLDNIRARASTLQRLQTTAAAELDALTPAILDRAFKGEL